MKKVEYFSISGEKLEEPIDWDRVHFAKSTERLTVNEVMKKYNLTPEQWKQAIKK